MSSKKQKSGTSVIRVPLDKIVPTYGSPDENPNKMDVQLFEQMVEMIRLEGDLQPVLTYPIEDGRYKLVDGHHRYWASVEAQTDGIWIVVKSFQQISRAQAVGFGMNRYKGELDLSMSALMLGELAPDFDMNELSVLTGFSQEELETLLNAGEQPSEDEIMDDAAETTLPTDDEEKPERPFVLEVAFASKEEYRLARRKLKKAGGGDLARGLMVALGEE